MYQLVRSLPHVKFKIAGAPTNKTSNEILNCLEKLNSCDNVELVGTLNRDQVFFYLSKAYLLVNTSHFEGFSNTFLEALAVGTPIISRESIDPDQIISKYGLGITVKSYEEMGDAINTLIDDPKYDEVALKCKNYIEDHHDLDHICNQFAKVLMSIIPS
jgi:glycosyltransferase involved in cell wall biosynthesis